MEKVGKVERKLVQLGNMSACAHTRTQRAGRASQMFLFGVFSLFFSSRRHRRRDCLIVAWRLKLIPVHYI